MFSRRKISQATQLAFVVSASASFTLGGYEFIRSASNTLFKSYYGASALPKVMVLVPLAVLAVLYGYNRLLDKYGARRTLAITTVFSAFVLVACYMGLRLKWAPASAMLYLFREAYVVLLIEQYWSLLNSHLKDPEAKRLNGPITGFASLGAILGGVLVHRLAVPLGTTNMLVFGALSLLPAALVSDLAYRKFGEPKPSHSEEKKHRLLGLALFKDSRLLRYLLSLIVITQLVSTVIGLNFQEVLQTEMPDPDLQTSFSGSFFAGLNALAALFQFVLAPLLMRWISIKWIHLLIPIVHLVSCLNLVFVPSLWSAGLAYLLFKSLDYSIFRASKEMFYIPLSFDARYRAKELIDVFGYRFGKGGTSLAIVGLQRMGVVFHSLYGWVALFGVGLWIGCVGALAREVEGTRKAASP